MRASRLLHILLLLQNRGRMTAAALAAELEVVPRTILRDVDALTEAGLPIIVFQGNRGGIELGFNYRTRLTGLAADEAEAMGWLLAQPSPGLDALGLGDAAARARSKLLESFPDGVRQRVAWSQHHLRQPAMPRTQPDPRLAALADAIRERQVVRLRARTRHPLIVHPLALEFASQGWLLHDARAPETPLPESDWGDINISRERW